MIGWARVGAKCRCVRIGEVHPGTAIPKKGSVYTIRRVGIAADANVIIANFVELPCVNAESGREIGLELVGYFIPLASRTLIEDVAVFQSIANHIDPIVRADEMEREFIEGEARLAALWDAMSKLDLP